MGELIKFEVSLRAFVRKERPGTFVAVIPSLGVASQGTSIEDAKRSVREAVELWFESCIERGMLDQALREVGFIPSHGVEPGSEHVTVTKLDQEDVDDVRGEQIPVTVKIPAYQAAVFLSQSA